MWEYSPINQTYKEKIDNPIPLKYGMWDANKGEYIAL